VVNTKVKIGNRWVGDEEPCFIIAEAGSNHDGKKDQALQLISVAAEAGADAVKFQVFRAASLYAKKAGASDYLQMEKSIYEIISDMEMPYGWLPELAAFARARGILFLASVFDEESTDQLSPHVEAFKIASYEMTHIPLIRHVAKKGKPVIMSTGTADLEEVGKSVRQFMETGNRDLILMQCTAAYPAPIESLNVRALSTLKKAFGIPSGLSDHSRDPIIGPLAAVGQGAHVIEKHFTLSNDLPGPDHRFAVEPEELGLMIRKVREMEKALGTGNKETDPVEEELRRFARRSIFATKDIPKGGLFTRQNIAVLRCGNLTPGLEPSFFDTVLGMRARRDIAEEEPILEQDYGPSQ